MATNEHNANAIRNVSGAVMFVAYVLVALLLTCLIAVDLCQAYRAQSNNRPSRAAKNRYDPSLVFASLAVLSFSTLSYHMLSYLVYSYQRWATSESSLPLLGRPQPGHLLSVTRIWQWLTQSTLFRDFAQTICEGNSSWWTQQALLAAMASALFVAVEGKCRLRCLTFVFGQLIQRALGSRRKVPHLWAYLAIGQILPISFAQSLFFIAMVLIPVPDPARMVQVPGSRAQWLPLVAYYISVFSAPFSVGEPVFVSLLITIRMLLLCPFVLRLPALESFGSRAVPAQSIHSGYSASYKLALLCSMLVFVHRSYLAWVGDGISQTLAAIDSNPAVSALGYDFILYIIISSTWAVLNPNIIDVSP